MSDAATLHVIPVGDVIEHDDEGVDCVCGPDSEWVIGQYGAHGQVVVHHALDGRENWEEPHR